MERLYGIVHGGQQEIAGIPVGEVYIGPSIELLQNLRELPKGTKVGVEWTPEFNSPIRVSRVNMTIPDSNRAYWEEIIGHCQSLGHNLVYLEDFPTWKKAAGLMVKADRFNDELDGYEIFQPNDPETQILRRKAYRAGVLKSYAFEIEREDKMLEAIVKNNPDVVIAGKAHADYMADSVTQLSQRGIQIGSYVSEQIPEMLLRVGLEFRGGSMNKRRGTLLYNPQPDQDLLHARRALQRQYNAITVGRIAPADKPAFIGSWDLVPERGLFEMYPMHESKFWGMVEDTIGTATFFGELRDDSMVFQKQYGAATSGAAKGVVEYRAEKDNDGVYRGSYRGPNTSGLFIARAGNELPELKLAG